MKLLRDICEIYAVQGYTSNVLAASLRHPMHVVDAALAGADIATMPYDVFTKLVKHPLTDSGLERFLADWRSSTANSLARQAKAAAREKPKKGREAGHRWKPWTAARWRESSSRSCSRSRRRWGSKEPSACARQASSTRSSRPRRTASDRTTGKRTRPPLGRAPSPPSNRNVRLIPLKKRTSTKTGRGTRGTRNPKTADRTSRPTGPHRRDETGTATLPREPLPRAARSGTIGVRVARIARATIGRVHVERLAPPGRRPRGPGGPHVR